MPSLVLGAHEYQSIPLTDDTEPSQSSRIMGDFNDSEYIDPEMKEETTKKPYFGMTGNLLNAWVTVACTTAMTLFGMHRFLTFHVMHCFHPSNPGYDQGVFGGIIVTQNFLDTMGNPGPNLLGTIVSLYDIGWFVVSLFLSLSKA